MAISVPLVLPQPPLGPALTSPWSCPYHPLVYNLLTITYLTLLNLNFFVFFIILYARYRYHRFGPVFTGIIGFGLTVTSIGHGHRSIARPVDPYPTHFARALFCMV
jgi:hypothetical protein